MMSTLTLASVPQPYCIASRQLHIACVSIARQYSIFKDHDFFSTATAGSRRSALGCTRKLTAGFLLYVMVCALVGLGRFELPTSPLSGVRSSHLSYRPGSSNSGGAGRDRTGDLLNANQALSQLSYSPLDNASCALRTCHCEELIEASWTQGSQASSRMPL